MKFNFGPLSLSLAEKKIKAPDTSEVGGSGTTIISGQVVEDEYNADLRGGKAITVYDKMRRSDARVKTSLLACELPLRAVDWSITPASDQSGDKDIAERLENNLFSNRSFPWDNFMHHVLIMLWSGFSIFEKVWEIADGEIRYKKFAPRLPKTLYQWKVDEHGSLTGIEQYVWLDNTYKIVPIPAEKLLIFTNDKEGGNFEGISILRAAYKHWYYKDHLYRIDAIASERHAQGVPYVKTPETADDAAKNAVDSILEHLQAHEKLFIRLGEGYEFDIKGLSGSIKDLLPSIEHHNKAISESVLADFLSLGAGDRGSWALSKDKSSFFLMSLAAVGANICDTFNAYAIPQWVDYNYAGVKDYPKLTIGSLDTRNMKEYADAATELLQAGGITPGEDTEAYLRNLLKMPPKEGSEQPVKQSEKKHFHGAEVPKTRRALTYGEGFVAFDEIEKRLDDDEQKFVTATREVMTRQIDNLVDEAARIIEKRQLDKIDSLEVRYRSQMADKMYSILKDLVNYGRKQVKREMQAQKGAALADPAPIGPEDLALIEELLKARSKSNALALANKLKQFITFESLSQIKRGVLDKEALRQGLLDLSDRELVAAAKYSTSEAFNFGRGFEAEKEKDGIDRCQYSAIMDPVTCEECSPLDGQEWPYDDPRTEKYASGNPDCLGGGKCRCVLIYIARAESRAVR